MNPREGVALAPFTTFHIGGPARFFIEATMEEEVGAAMLFARTHNLPLFPLGAGSNVLVPDEGVEGVVLKMALRDVAFEHEGDDTLLIAGAGASWDDVVEEACARGFSGIENLAGIPGTVGGAVVQNIGAYGAEFSNVFAYAETLESATLAHARITRPEAAFGYRTSFFKTHPTHVIKRVALRLSKRATPNFAYPDLARARAAGVLLTTPSDVARAVRFIRAEKFPHRADEGTAGSFFKNPVVDEKTLACVRARYPDLPVYPMSAGGGSASGGKVSLAWLLDHALSMKGYAIGRVRLYEKQPLIVVACAGATAAEVDALARDVMERVHAATGIMIEREVETFGRNGK